MLALLLLTFSAEIKFVVSEERPKVKTFKKASTFDGNVTLHAYLHFQFLNISVFMC